MFWFSLPGILYFNEQEEHKDERMKLLYELARIVKFHKLSILILETVFP